MDSRSFVNGSTSKVLCHHSDASIVAQSTSLDLGHTAIIGFVNDFRCLIFLIRYIKFFDAIR